MNRKRLFLGAFLIVLASGLSAISTAETQECVLEMLDGHIQIRRNPEMPGDTDIEKMSRIAKALHAIHVPIEVDRFKAETTEYDFLEDAFKPAELAEYVEGWTYRVDREMPPDQMSAFSARGYSDAAEVIG